MARRVQIKDVDLPRHLTVFPFRERDPSVDTRVRMEVYTGWIVSNFYGGGGPIHREDFVSFLPINDNFFVNQYPVGSDVLDRTITVTPSTFQDDDDETNLVGVDDAFVDLEAQTGLQGDPLCLVLRTRVAVHHLNLISIAYNVTVLTEGREDLPDPIELKPNQTPTS
jgi:hypothetical protein